MSKKQYNQLQHDPKLYLVIIVYTNSIFVSSAIK